MATRRRRTFWTGATELSTPAANSTTSGEVTFSNGVTDIMETDAAPTLARVVGVLVVEARRDNSVTPAPAGATSQTEFWSWGLMCMDALDTVNPSDVDGLGDERWMYTTHGVATAPLWGDVYWNSQTNAEVIRTKLVHVDKPDIRMVDIRVMRKFEDPCVLVAHAAREDANGLDPLGDIRFYFRGRALWLAS